MKKNNKKEIKVEIKPTIYSTKKFIVIDVDGEYEYDIIVDETDEGTLFSLYLSNGNQWNEHAKGMFCISMLDTGNGVKFNPELSEMDYSQLNYIRLLTNLEVELDNNPRTKDKYSVIEIKDVIKL